MDDEEHYAPVTEDEIKELIKDAANPIVPRDNANDTETNTNDTETDQVETIEQNEGNEADGTAAKNVEVTNEPAEETAIDIEPEESSDEEPEDQEQNEVSESITSRPRRTITKPEILTCDKLGGRSGNYAKVLIACERSYKHDITYLHKVCRSNRRKNAIPTLPELWQ